MKAGKFIAKISYYSLQFTRKYHNFVDSVLCGFWLGVLSENALDHYDDLHYSGSKKYFDESYNLSGLAHWEKERIEKFFSEGASILLLAAGGGRETYALNKMGYEVNSFECNQNLVDAGNGFLKKFGITNLINFLPRNSVPPVKVQYEGVIIGWGAYAHIRGADKRIDFLKSLKLYLEPEAPILISFVTRQIDSRQDRIVKNVANLFRIIFGRTKVEIGDRLFSYSIHFFTGKEINYELEKAGYKLLDYYDNDYGCAVARVCKYEINEID